MALESGRKAPTKVIPDHGDHDGEYCAAIVTFFVSVSY